ncbi:MAG: class I SAM-dependent methyltransferase [Gammaproteobacteria bacterium]
METRWQDIEISNDFDIYQDTLEQLLGYSFVYNWLNSISSSNKILLDYGCGPGKVTYHIATNNKWKIIAVDESDNMLNIAKKKRSHPLITYRKVIDDNLFYLQDASVDATILCFVLLNHGSKDRIINILKEVNRVLKPDGNCILLDTNPDSIGIKFTTFQSGTAGRHYEYGSERDARLFLPNGKVLNLTGYHWPKQMYYEALNEAGFYVENEKLPVLSELDENKLIIYKNIHLLDPINTAEWNKPPFILFRAYKKYH